MFRIRLRALFLLTCAALLGAGPVFGAAGDEPKVLNIYNWSDYIADDTIKNFERPCAAAAPSRPCG